ncbi:unnamed protein product, partial [Mesorhabditis spiculigera]
MLVGLTLAVFFARIYAEDCEEGWTPYKVMNSCYKMINGQAFWHAEAECAEQGAHLTSVLNDEENQFIENMISKKIPGNDAWVGAMVMTRNVTGLHWMDGSLVNQKVGNWTGFLSIHQNDFCTLKNGNGQFQHTYCWELNKGICKRPMGQAAVALEKPLCDEGWTGSKWTGSCYKVTPKSKSGAGQETCFEWGAKPASALTYLEHEDILAIAEAGGSNHTFLGAKREGDGNYTWIDGSNWDYVFWSAHGGPHLKDANCLGTWNDVGTLTFGPHRWFSYPCDKELHTMCKKPGNKKPAA